MDNLFNSDLAHRLHCHEVVCRTALKLTVNVPGFRHYNTASRNSLGAIAERDFNLTEKQASYCLNRARNFLIEVREADRLRNKKALKSHHVISV